MECVQAEGLVLLNVGKYFQKSVSPGGVAVISGDGIYGLGLINPAQQIINILKMIVECFSIQLTIRDDVFDGDFIEGQFIHQLLQ